MGDAAGGSAAAWYRAGRFGGLGRNLVAPMFSAGGQAAVAEHKRETMHTEYAAEVEKMKAEAKERKRGGQGGKLLPQTFGEANDPHERETDAQRAKAAGTNRRR
ncbi:MAG: hypothetical protein RBS80_00015 [Thermoguttaceae bacterium]|nr:hypothetical protein [Thermoguttaceae bacterium]